ncbi:MAG TPA: glycosyltransferase [Candidatus Limnocylindrales bacterium]|nr:glycosyltransferase [Candidatus Limnocylindrales bacterium]
MRVLVWHVRGSWTNSFVQGEHTYLIPVLPDRGPDGRGRAETYDWPRNAVEITPVELRTSDVDVVVLQRPHELRLAQRWLGRTVPAIYVEHDTPNGDVPNTRHPMADRDGLVIAHVTHFNDLFWDCGGTPRTVIEHGIADPGARYTGELARAAAVINEPKRRRRGAGTDLLPQFANATPIDLFGRESRAVPKMAGVAPQGDPGQARLHEQMARRRAYLHPFRWTSLGFTLIEAMMLGMPVVALATTEAIEAVPPEAGFLSTRVGFLSEALSWLLGDAAAAGALGARARAAALSRYSLKRFIDDWDQLLKEVRG